MAKKVYAVKEGWQTGLFYSWDKCKEQVNGYPRAKFKGFENELDAEVWLNDVQKPNITCESIAYTDGSYNDDTHITGGGGVLIYKGQEHYFALCTTEADTEYNNMRNVGGEILAARAAAMKAKELGIKSLHIYHDYEGVGAWVKGEWKTNKPMTQEYVEFMNSMKKNGLKVIFSQVDAHSGDVLNDKADEIAKYAVGLAGGEVRVKYPNLQWVEAFESDRDEDLEFDDEDISRELDL